MRRDGCWVSLVVAVALALSVAGASAAVVVNAPSEGQTIHRSLAVEYTCERAEGYVTISLDSKLLAAVACKPGPNSFRADLSSVADGTHKLSLAEQTPDGKVVSTVEVNVQVQNTASAELLQNGVSLFDREAQGTYKVLVAGLTRLEEKASGSLPDALKALDFALRAEVTDSLSAPAPDGMQRAVRTVESGFLQRYSPTDEKATRAPLADAGLSVAFLVGSDGLPRLSGAQPFVLGLPVLALPNTQARIGYTWSAPMLTVLDLTSRRVGIVEATHRLKGFDWINNQACAVIQSTWQREGPVEVILWDRPFTFSKVASSGTRTSYYVYDRGIFISAQEQVRNKVTASPQEVQQLRNMLFSAKVKQLTEADFSDEVLQSPVPVLVEFMTEWCPHCKASKEPLDATAKDYLGRAKVVLVDTEKNPNLGAAYGVAGWPDFRIFVNGQPVWQLVTGFAPEVPMMWRQALNQVLAGGAPVAGPGPTAGRPVGPRLAPAAQPQQWQPAPAPAPGAARRRLGGARRSEKSAMLPGTLTPSIVLDMGGPYQVAEAVTQYDTGAGSVAAFQGRSANRGWTVNLPPVGGAAYPAGAAAVPGAAPAYSRATPAAGYGQQPVAGTVLDLNDQTLGAAISASRVPVLLYFYSQARPDPEIDQGLAQLAATYAGYLQAARVDLDTNPQSANWAAPDNQPAFAVLSGGQLIYRQPASAPVVQQAVNYLTQNRLLPQIPGVVQARPLEFAYIVETVSQVQ
jgi:thioredoxin 1